MGKRTALVLSFLFLAFMISVPGVSADSHVQIGMPQESCNLYPLGGTTYCDVGPIGTMKNDATSNYDTDRPMTFSWSYDSTRFSVVVTGYTCASPCNPYTMTNPQTFNSADNRFDFRVTYTAATCQNGQYYLTFNLASVNGMYHDQAIFTMYARCVLAPLP